MIKRNRIELKVILQLPIKKYRQKCLILVLTDHLYLRDTNKLGFNNYLSQSKQHSNQIYHKRDLKRR